MIQGMIHSNTMMHGTLRNSLSLYGTIKPETVPKLRKISGLPPLTYTAKEEGTLKNYRIYGQTVDGESVGDRTGNLFNGDLQKGFWINATDLGQTSSEVFRSFKIFLPAGTYTLSFEINVNIVRLIADGTLTQNVENNLAEYTVTTQTDGDIGFSFRLTGTTQVPWDNSDIMLNEGSTALPYEPYGYKVPVTVEGKNLCNNIWEQKMIDSETGNASPNETTVCCDFIPVKPNVTYSCSRTIANNYNNLRCYGANKDYLGSGADLVNKANPLIQRSSFGTFMITDARVSYIRFNDFSNSLDTKYMLVEGAYTAETMPTYEPYHAPITTPIYLPEPIKMVGDEAEYIDFMEQKQHFADGTSVDVTLPALPTLPGTNVLSVGTEVQPSEVEVTGRIRPVPTGGGE